MAEANDPIERFFWAMAKRSSGRVIAGITGTLYFGVGLAVPLILGWPASWLIAANVAGTMFAGVILLIWLMIQVKARERRQLVEWTTDLRRLNAREFEWLVGELLRREGWKVKEVGRQGAPDGGVDLSIARGADRRIVQCKRWTSRFVGVDAIRTFAGTLGRDGSSGKSGILVTLSEFTEQARAEAERMGMTLWDHRDLYGRVEKVRRHEPCRLCGRPMLFDRSPHGWWFRCLTPGCQGKRDLSREPGIAIELLTAPPD
jgi:HJR/Mrr/RecB family endonuclease